MLFTLFKFRSLLTLLPILFGALALFGVARWYSTAACGVFVLMNMLYYSSDDARIVYWLQGYKAIRRSDSSLPVNEVKGRLVQEFTKSKRSDGTLDIQRARDFSLDQLIVEFSRIEFRFRILARDTLVQRLVETNAKTKKYAKALPIASE